MATYQKRILIYWATIFGMMLFIQGCSPFRSNETYQDRKLKFLSQSSISGRQEEPQEPVPLPTITYPDVRNPEGPEPKDPVTPPPPPPPEKPDPVAEFPMPNFCGTQATQWVGYTVRNANEDLKLAFLDDAVMGSSSSTFEAPPDSPNDGQLSNVKPICEFVDADIRPEILNQKMLRIKKLNERCPNLQPGTYTLSLVKASQTRNYQRNLLLAMSGLNLPALTPAGINLVSIWPFHDQEYMGWRTQAVVTRDGNGKLRVTIRGANGVNGPMVLSDIHSGHGGQGCDGSYSPLVVQMGNKPLKLTSPDLGVWFDIEGQRAAPVAHTKRKISWFDRAAGSSSYFIVKPNARGEVNGIDEMFGDNTFGPDKRKPYAPHGYAALAKWDGRRANGTYGIQDGFIMPDDEVFSQLRLWNDKNFDGVAQANELYTLKEMNVAYIDLHGEEGFSEQLNDGNRIMLKSALGTNDGQIHVMYDLWFSGAQAATPGLGF